MPSPVSSKQIRHELVFLARPSFGDRNIPAILHQVGMEAIHKNRPYLRGDVIGPRGTLFAGTNMTALYVAQPVYLPDSFATYESPTGVARVFAWLVPITCEEGALVKTKGWRELDEKFCTVDPDLLDFNRPSVA